MVTLLGSLIGFLGSALPSVLGFFNKKQEQSAQLEVIKLQADLSKQGAQIDLMKFHAMAADNEHQRLLEHDTAMQKDTGPLSWLRKSVRPIITYLFFTLFALVKVTTLVHGYEESDNFYTAVHIVWDSETQAIFAAIISFWFGSRALERNARLK